MAKKRKKGKYLTKKEVLLQTTNFSSWNPNTIPMVAAMDSKGRVPRKKARKK